MSDPSIPSLLMGVCGVGALGQHHARILASMPGVQLAGVHDADPARAAEIAAKHGVRAFASLEDLAASVDAACVVVPTDLHHAVATQLLQAGLHLLIEKPIAATTAEAEDLVRLAQKRNLILQVGHIERFNPVLSVLEGRPAAPRFIEAHRLAPYPPPREGLHPRGTEVSVVLDLMIHDIEVILHLVRSEVTDVRAVGVPVLSPSEDIANVRLEFANGCVANITASRISPERMRKIRVFYADAYLSLDYQEQSGELHRRTATGIVREDIPIDKGDALTLELSSFTDCVRRRGTPIVSGEHASRALRLAVRITQLVRGGR
ncbi:MAG: Gfo/Idh/MocA family oxidoreductase [Kiritimatiellia bacterium]